MLLSCTVFGQDIESTISKLEYYQQQTPLEKAYVRTDREVYFQNEYIWFSVYLVDATTFLANTPSSLVYVDLLDPEKKVISSHAIKVEEGFGSGEFFLPDTLMEGYYTIMAYTHYMRNFGAEYFFSKPLNIINDSSDELEEKKTANLELQFFPEGGNLVDGLVNMVAFKAINEEGYGVELNGKIVNQRDEIVANFSAEHNGMGVFPFISEAGETYYAEYSFNGNTLAMPFLNSRSSGYQLSVRQDKSRTYITVNSTPDLTFADCFVLAHIRGKVISVIRASEDENYIYHTMNDQQVQSGIIHLTLFKSGRPYAERLVFNENSLTKPKLEIVNIDKKIENRALAGFELGMSDKGQDISGNVSVSILKKENIQTTVDIESYLLLTSDLKGVVEKPAYYFELNNTDRKKHIDLLMRTHGWRRFSWNDVLESKLPIISFFPQRGFTVEGRVVEYNNQKKSKSSKVILNSVEDFSIQLESETDEDGIFWFDGLQVFDTANLLVRTIEKNPSKRQKKKAANKGDEEDIQQSNSYIELKDATSPLIVMENLQQKKRTEEYHQLIADNNKIDILRQEFDPKSIILEEVAITSKRSPKSDPYYRDEVMMPYNNPDSRVIIDSLQISYDHYFDIFNFVKMLFPLVKIGKDENGLKMFKLRKSVNPSLIGNSIETPLVVYLDGRKLVSNAQLYAISPQTIEFVDLMRGFTIIYSEPYPPPQALFLYTRKTSAEPNPNGFQMLQLIGYHQPAEFYTPKYDIMTPRENLRPDYRITQYWNPSVKIENNKGYFEYFTSDDKGEFVISIEGITNNGYFIRDNFSFTIE